MKSNEEQLSHITDLINEYNETNDRFRLEIFISKKDKRKYLTFQQVQDRVCAKFKLTPEYLYMDTREPEIVRPRQIAHYMAKEHCKFENLGQIGHFFGGKDHSTVTHSAKSIQNLLDTDKDFREKYWTFIKDVF